MSSWPWTLRLQPTGLCWKEKRAGGSMPICSLQQNPTGEEVGNVGWLQFPMSAKRSTAPSHLPMGAERSITLSHLPTVQRGALLLLISHGYKEEHSSFPSPHGSKQGHCSFPMGASPLSPTQCSCKTDRQGCDIWSPVGFRVQPTEVQ